MQYPRVFLVSGNCGPGRRISWKRIAGCQLFPGNDSVVATVGMENGMHLWWDNWIRESRLESICEIFCVGQSCTSCVKDIPGQ